MHNKSNKFSITKKSVWSLILQAKYFKANFLDDKSQVSIEKSLNGIKYRFEYDIQEKKVITMI